MTKGFLHGCLQFKTHRLRVVTRIMKLACSSAENSAGHEGLLSENKDSGQAGRDVREALSTYECGVATGSVSCIEARSRVKDDENAAGEEV